MRQVIFALGLLAFGGMVNAEVVYLTCTASNGPYNLTIATPPSVKSPKVYWNDEESKNFGSYVHSTDSVNIGTSEIKFATNLRDTDSDMTIRIVYNISRVSGKLTTIGFYKGKDPKPGDIEQCEPRRANKF